MPVNKGNDRWRYAEVLRDPPHRFSSILKTFSDLLNRFGGTLKPFSDLLNRFGSLQK